MSWKDFFFSTLTVSQLSTCASGQCRTRPDWNWRITRQWVPDYFSDSITAFANNFENVLPKKVLTEVGDSQKQQWTEPQRSKQLGYVFGLILFIYLFYFSLGILSLGVTFNLLRFSIAICRVFPSTGELSQATASLCQEVGVYLHASRGPGQVSELSCHGNTGSYNRCCKVIYTKPHKVHVHLVGRLHFWSISLTHLTVRLSCWSTSILRRFVSQEGVKCSPTTSTLDGIEIKGKKEGWFFHVSVQSKRVSIEVRTASPPFLRHT